MGRGLADRGKTMSFYTSYSTSLALKDAGAPQDQHVTPSGPVHWTQDLDRAPRLCPWVGGKQSIRAFRSDEIIEALVALDALDSIRPPEQIVGEWRVEVRFEPSGMHGLAVYEPTLVEALARCWLAVLGTAATSESKEGK